MGITASSPTSCFAGELSGIVRLARRAIDAAIARHLSAVRLSPLQYAILCLLTENSGRLPAITIERRLAISSRLLERATLPLLDRGILERHRSRGLAIEFRLTTMASALMLGAVRLYDDAIAELAAGVGPDVWEHGLEFLRRLSTSVRT